MKNKKTISMIVAMMLICVISIAGTLAYLTAQTGAVTNTFAAAGLLDKDDDFDLKEHKAREPHLCGEGGHR